MRALLVLASVSVAIAFGVGARAGILHEREKRRLFARAKPWADAAPGELAVIVGKVEAPRDGALVGPISGKPAVWVEIVGSEDRASSGEQSFVEFLRIESSREMRVEFDDGAALVPLGADATKLARSVSSGPVVSPSPQLVDFVRSLGKEIPESSDGFTRRREYTERRVEVGAPIVAIVSKPEAARLDAYRTNAAEPETLAPEFVELSDYNLLTNELTPAARVRKGIAYGVGALLMSGILSAVFGSCLTSSD
jgi:hypothetical protein